MSLWSAGRGAGKMSTVVLPTPKQIRFVNNEGRPPAKRRRVDAACQTCRKRKIRCDGKRPQCSTCKENRHVCLGYEASPLTSGAAKTSDTKKFAVDDADEDDDDDIHEDIKPKIPSPTARRVDTKLHGVLSEEHRVSVESNGYGNHSPGAAVDNTAYTDDGQNSQTLNRRVPYFRWFGPTAIVRGFKQMVVSVGHPGRKMGPTSLSSASPLSNSYSPGGDQKFPNPRRSSMSIAEPRNDLGLPLYDISNSEPVPSLIRHLVKIFFIHLGCNFPFLRKDKVLRMMDDKHLAPILVDAICSLSARFSEDPQLVASFGPKRIKSEYGQAFAQRAKAVVTDTFLCPTVEALQACLLLAYEAFGDNKDSALWMYTGCAIRMASDLGLEKLDGIRIQGGRLPNYSPIHNDFNQRQSDGHSDADTEQKASEQERIDTLWAIFTLDRFISSGLGRPATMRREDFELGLPVITMLPKSDWPAPLPALIQIIHLYGRVSDLLNGIKGTEDMTEGRLQGLEDISMEVTAWQESLGKKLAFNLGNFSHYDKAGEGTNFILLHFWYHTLIMVVYCPQLWNSAIAQLLPDGNRKLSMSSAKTIADILAFAFTNESKCFVGNPFTSQPMYFAASAFLMETNIQKASSPASREGSPHKDTKSSNKAPINVTIKCEPLHHNTKQTKVKAQSNPSQDYQCCYKALQQLETYWAGTKYILTALDQKAIGIADPEAFTSEEMESTKVRPGPVQDWKRTLPPPFAQPSPSMKSVAPTMSPKSEGSASPTVDGGSNQPIWWALTGTTNSPNSNVTLMFPQAPGDTAPPAPPPATGPPQNKFYDPIRPSVPESTRPTNITAPYSPYNLGYSQHQPQQHMPMQQNMAPPSQKYSMIDDTSHRDAAMLIELKQSPNPYGNRMAPNPYDTMSSQPSTGSSQHMAHGLYDGPVRYDFNAAQFGQITEMPYQGWGVTGYFGPGMDGVTLGPGDMTFTTRDVDLSNMNDDFLQILEHVQYVPNIDFNAGGDVGQYRGNGE
ncbi:hypothetical protein V496_10044 [Pseudogymnoascus sp. VKM F-4515 (FW-2607)]|nr:hypothetical protein V496_10044 [Pseudogymnoascus sp. VKM F-4515 (FW-2607)]KFY76949.1 hypothetical protein V498_09474 [Pseudogymnoascus sp. VKM F-4517 (FW-2822)]